MKKVYLFGLALSFCAVNGYAQRTIGSFADLKAAKDSVARINTYQEQLREAKTQYNSLLTGAYANEKPTESVPTSYDKGKVEKEFITAFCKRVLNGVGEDATLKIVREVSTDGAYRGSLTVSVYVEGQGNVPEGAVSVDTKDIISGDYNTCLFAGNSTTVISTLNIYIKTYNQAGEIQYELISQSGTKLVPAATNSDLEVVEKLNNMMGSFSTSVVTYYSQKKNDNYVTGKELIAANENLQSYLNAAINGGTWTIKSVAWNDEKMDVDVTSRTSEESHPGCINYKSLKLASEITISDVNFTMGDMAEDYKFDGANYKVTLNGATLFGTNKGRIINTIFGGGNLAVANSGTITDVTIEDGNVVDENNGTISNATVTNGTIAKIKGNGSHILNSLETNSSNISTVYGSDASTATVNGLDRSTYSNIYNNATLRDEFSVNVGNGIVSRGSDYKLYEVKQYSSKNKAGETRLANIDGNGNIRIRSSWTNTGIGEFYYVSNPDAGKLFDGIDASNIAKNVVYTHDGNNWECKVAEVSDSENTIYIPRSFVAAKVAYARQFNVAAEGASTICLPFDVDRATLDGMLGTDGKLLQFNKVDENGKTYWFKYVTGGMVANQPYILKFGQAVNTALFAGLENVTFAATGAEQSLSALAQSSEADGASLFGTFEKKSASELEDGAKYSIFGFSTKTGEFVRMTEQVSFLPTRAYVRKQGWTDPKASSSAKSYKMGILDENDNEVTAISSVEKAADKFDVKGGNGVITVNADKAQNVKVYTAGGALVKNADVVAGETSIPVSAGMYIVNGNKVVVK